MIWILKNNNNRIKLFLITLLILICLVISIYKQIKINELKRKFNSLLPFQQNIIDNYLINISSKYAIEKYNEAIKLF